MNKLAKYVTTIQCTYTIRYTPYAFIKYVQWVRRVGIRARETNNIIERVHSTLKTRSRVFRGLKNDKASQELLDGYITNYNFCRKHSSIKTTPAKSAGLNVEGWNELIQQSQIHKTNKEKELELMVTQK